MKRMRWSRRRFREAIADNQWLLPAIGALLGFLLAMAIGTGGGREADPWTVSVDRARDTLLTSLGLVFTALSIVLALASVASQNVVGRFGSRVLRIHGRRSPDNWVIAAFAMAAVFIVTEQFQLRRLDPDSPAPIAGLVTSMLLLFLTGSLVIWYISSLIRWFRTDRTVAVVVERTRRVARKLERNRRGVPVSLPERPPDALDLPVHRSGHVAEVDTDVALQALGNVDAMAVVTAPIGAPVVVGDSIGWEVSRDPSTELRPGHGVKITVDVSGTRELGESLEYGIAALVDIAIIALSPAVNDPNSAVVVIEDLSFLFPDLASAPLGPHALPDGDSWPRIVVARHSFGELVTLATEQIVLYGADDPNVRRALRRFAESLQRIELDESDRAHVDAFAASIPPTPGPGTSS